MQRIISREGGAVTMQFPLHTSLFLNARKVLSQFEGTVTLQGPAIDVIGLTIIWSGVTEKHELFYLPSDWPRSLHR